MKLTIKIVIALCFSSNFLFAQNKPELFVLSVGVSKYQNPKYNLSFADKDALDLAEAFKKQIDLFEGIFPVIIIRVDNGKRFFHLFPAR